MLIRYKRSFEKIAMGLLSFMPTEKDLKKLQETMKQYEESDNWQLYLWKEVDDIVGIIGISLEDDRSAVLQHVSVNPSHRDQGVGKKMIEHLKTSLDDKFEIVANEQTQEFYKKCIDEEES